MPLLRAASATFSSPENLFRPRILNDRQESLAASSLIVLGAAGIRDQDQ